MTVDIDDMRARAKKWLQPLSGEPPITRNNALSEDHLALDVLELIDELQRLRETLAHTCTCSLADGSKPTLRHEATCELRIAKTKRIDPALALSRFAKAMDSADEVQELEAKLAAMTAERDAALVARTVRCGWCLRAFDEGDRNTQIAAVREHTLTCVVNPLAQKLAAMTAARDELAALAQTLGLNASRNEGWFDRINHLRAVGKESTP